jgi:hypothetical protein
MTGQIDQSSDLVRSLTANVTGVGDNMRSINQNVDRIITELVMANYISAVSSAFLARWEGEIVPEWNGILGRLDSTAEGTNKACALQDQNQQVPMPGRV